MKALFPLLALALLPQPLSAQALSAQSLSAQSPSAQSAAAPAQLFIAPSGEPFRAGAGEPYPVAKWFAAADSNGDGRLTLAEFLADGDRWFTMLDSSRNGELEASEIDAYEAAVLAPLTRRPGMGAPAAAAGPFAGPPRAGSGGLPRGAGAYGLIDIPHPVKAADQDMNSRVTLAEYHKVMAARFERLDVAAAEARRRKHKGAGEPTGELLLVELPHTPAQIAAETAVKRR